jgi:hypothetical protein
MKQHEAVIETLERLGGVATLAQLYKEVFKIESCVWQTKTPMASIRRIVQVRPEIYKIKPGLYGLTACKSKNDARGILVETEKNKTSQELIQSNHSYYQGLLLSIGKLRNLGCWAPNQDKNKPFLNTTIGALRTVDAMPKFSYDHFVQRSSTVDVVWFNDRKMPRNLFKVEHSTDIQNSLLKFNDLQDFAAQMFIVAHAKRRAEYESKLRFAAFQEIKSRVRFVDYDWLVKNYEHEVEASKQETVF